VADSASGTVARVTVSEIPARTRRTAARVATAAALTGGSLLALALPAMAETADDPAPALGLAKTLGLFVGVPIGAFLLIALLVAAPRLVHRTRTETDLGWYAEAVDQTRTDAPELGSAVTPDKA
jgi:hypothetical protein